MPETIPLSREHRFFKNIPDTGEREKIVAEHDNAISSDRLIEQHRHRLELFLDDPERARRFFELADSQLRWVEQTCGVSVRKRFPDIDKIFLVKPPQGGKSSFFTNLSDTAQNYIGHFIAKISNNNPHLIQELYADRGFRDFASLDEFVDEVSGYAAQHKLLGSAFANYSTRGIVLKSDVNPTVIYRSLSHELMHAWSFSSDVFNRDSTGEIKKISDKKIGYVNNLKIENSESKRAAFLGFNEWLTEYMQLESLQFQRDQQLGSDYTEPGPIGYHSGVMVLDHLFRVARQRAPEKFADLKNHLYRGYFTGETHGLRLLGDIFGKEFLKLLSTIQLDSQGLSSILVYLHKNENDRPLFDELVARSEKYNAGEGVQLLNGIIIKETA
jgi:hypothetical protein